jgi:glycosyltransferase involved in cell wall biosynthesis
MVSRPRIGIYVPGTGSGGPWRYVHSILKHIDLDEFEVVLFSDLTDSYAPRPAVRLDRPAASLADSTPHREAVPRRRSGPSAAAATVWRKLAPDGLKLWGGFGKECTRLARRFRRQPIDLLHTNNTGCEESAVAARLARIPCVLGTFHVDSTYDLRRERGGPAHRILEYLSNHCLDRAIAVSRATQRDWGRRTRLGPERVCTIHNGIDPDRFRRRLPREQARRQLGLPTDGRPILAGVGRLEEAKGFRYLLEALALLTPRYPTLTAILAGDGPLRPSLRADAARLGIGDRLLFAGFRNDVQLIYDAADIFVLPSLAETLGYAFLEAMATELPAVGTTVGGIPEVIVHGETGFLVPPRNPVALAEALQPLLDSGDLRRRLGQAGRQRVVRHFDEKDMVRRTIQVYREMVLK